MTRPPLPADAVSFCAPAYPNQPVGLGPWRYGFVWSVNGRRYEVHELWKHDDKPGEREYHSLRERYNCSVGA